MMEFIGFTETVTSFKRTASRSYLSVNVVDSGQPVNAPRNRIGSAMAVSADGGCEGRWE
ncbi:hypothetical protein KDC22_18350 [Paenibacillus tritici]|uniref:hypothetical protein n=1 Tax=Paenibacillus tritici TaxID=1873425 RepID=UPI001BA80EA2|nr:hypothetical protein [Paenibacillus tritici]QUL52418.1 hypothetical protein KDC22_18350 [Paenibacillus tritici]